MSQVEHKRAFNKLKHDLEPWRNMIVAVNSLLTWEKQYYPAIICMVNTAFYLMLWFMDLSVVTLLSLAGLLFICGDFIYPTISRLIFTADNWNGQQEMQFESVVTQLCYLKTMIGSYYETLFNAKERKSTPFVIIMSVFFLGLAWVGAKMNNLLLMYILSLGITLYPGIRERALFSSVGKNFGGVLNSKMQQWRDKPTKFE